MKKYQKILLLPIITLVSYLFCDDPTPHPEFDKLSFLGRMKYYLKQIEEDTDER